MSVLSDLQAEVQAKTDQITQLESTLADLQAQLADLQEQIKEPFQVTCSECGTQLIITPPTGVMPQVLTMVYCPVCEAEVWEAPTEGYTIAPGIVGEEAWYKKYAPHLVIGGGLAAALIYFLRKK